MPETGVLKTAIRGRLLLRSGVAAALMLAGTGAGADVYQDKNALRLILNGYRDGQNMVPLVSDTDAYLHRDIQTALAIAQGAGGDDCTKAVRMALFLDAHRLPDVVDMAGRLYDTGLLGDLGGIWLKPDEGNIMDDLAWGWGTPLWNSADLANKGLQSLDAFVEATNAMVRANRDLWVQEAVDLSLRSDWDADQLAHANGRLDHQVERASEWVMSTERWAQARLDGADNTLEKALKDAQSAWKGAHDRLRQELGERRYSDDTDRVSLIKRIEIENAFFNAKAAAHARRAATMAEVWTVREENLKMALQDLAKARVQKAALAHYTAPIIAGDCAVLSRPKAPLTPADCPPGGADCTPVVPVTTAPRPEGGHWQMVEHFGKLRELNRHECYVETGQVGNGSASFSNSKPKCGDPWPPYSISYSWTAPPVYLVPGETYEISAQLSGSFGGEWGEARMYYGIDHPETDCGFATAAREQMIRTEDGGTLGIAWNGAKTNSVSGLLSAPQKGYGGGKSADGVPRFQVKATPNPAGCYRYIFEWRE